MRRLKIMIGYLRNLFIAVSNRTTILASLIAQYLASKKFPGQATDQRVKIKLSLQQIFDPLNLSCCTYIWY